MNVILGLCHSYSGKVVIFQESLFACKRKLSKTSRLLRRAATGNCKKPDEEDVTSSKACVYKQIKTLER